jgi:hypothetical protein
MTAASNGPLSSAARWAQPPPMQKPITALFFTPRPPA